MVSQSSQCCVKWREFALNLFGKLAWASPCKLPKRLGKSCGSDITMECPFLDSLRIQRKTVKCISL